MPKEYRFECMSQVFLQRPTHAVPDRPLMERDVSEWRPCPLESGVLSELRHLRAMPKDELERALGVVLTRSGNPYEMDVAILFHLVKIHGCAAVQDAVLEMLGGNPVIKS